MSDATPILPFVSDVMNGLGPYWMTGLAVGLGGSLLTLVLRLVRSGLRGWPGI